MRVALDAMGGDHAPQANLDGARLALAESDVGIALVGPKDLLESELAQRKMRTSERLTIVDAPEVVGMHEAATTPLRRKRKSSLWIAATLVRDGVADVMVSAGNTGAAMISAIKVMGRVEGIDRPALAAVLPTRAGHTVLIDVGANVDCKPQQLLEFAVMGHFYSNLVVGVTNPRIGLLSIGEEDSKGNELTRGVFKALGETGFNFAGNVEGRDIFGGEIDVVVCDGFVGNVVLKGSESLAEMIEAMLREEITRSFKSSVGFLLAKNAFRRFKQRLDYSEYGGVPLLGVQGGCIICHGRSTAKAIKNAIRSARTIVDQRFNDRLKEKMAEVHRRERMTPPPREGALHE